MTNNLHQSCRTMARDAKQASRVMASADPARKNAFLIDFAQRLIDQSESIVSANACDLKNAAELNLTAAQVDRLTLTPQRICSAAHGVREIAAQPEPIGRVLESSVRPNGLRVDRVAVPLGVLFFLYESRPNVTVDAAALAIKSGNAIILRGGKEAAHSNKFIGQLIAESLRQAQLPFEAVQLVASPDRNAVGHFLAMPEFIDLAIPRGGESLITRVMHEAKMPVMKHFRGNCHVYVDGDADLEMAIRIIVNAKCQRPGVCNATESLLVHREIAPVFLPRVAAELLARGVELRGCHSTRSIVPQSRPATDDDFASEFLDLILSIKVVEDVSEAIGHISRFGSGHTDAIITNNLNTSRRFVTEVDSAAVMVNASTRLHDGSEIGLGAEIGISTSKFHARGPCGLRELTSYKYVVHGDGQIRE